MSKRIIIKINSGILIVLLFSIGKNANAQFNETIRTGRPGQAIGPFAVGKNVFQLQAGVDFGAVDASDFKSNAVAPNAVLRFGLTKTFEINSAWEYRTENLESDSTNYSQNGLSLATVGMRLNILEGKGYRPAVGFQFTLKMPILSEDYNPNYLAPKFLLIARERLSDKFALFVNVGASYSGNNAEPVGVYVLNLSYSINKKWGTFIENYGNYTTSIFENRWDTGLSYLANNNLQWDVYGGAGYNDGTVNYFVSLGVSYRIISLHNKELNNQSK